MSKPRCKRYTKHTKQRERAKSVPIKHEDTEKFRAYDMMMRSNRGISIG